MIQELSCALFLLYQLYLRSSGIRSWRLGTPYSTVEFPRNLWVLQEGERQIWRRPEDSPWQNMSCVPSTSLTAYTPTCMSLTTKLRSWDDCFSCSVVSNSATPWTIAHQAPLSIGFPRQEYWSVLLFPSPRDLSDPGIECVFPAWQVDSLPLSHLGIAQKILTTLKSDLYKLQRKTKDGVVNSTWKRSESSLKLFKQFENC